MSEEIQFKAMIHGEFKTKPLVFACDIREGRKYLINGVVKTIQRIIPMQDSKTNKIYDIEFLTDKKLNEYFSYDSYVNGQSWVKDIEEL